MKNASKTLAQKLLSHNSDFNLWMDFTTNHYDRIITCFQLNLPGKGAISVILKMCFHNKPLYYIKIFFFLSPAEEECAGCSSEKAFLVLWFFLPNCNFCSACASEIVDSDRTFSLLRSNLFWKSTNKFYRLMIF